MIAASEEVGDEDEGEGEGEEEYHAKPAVHHDPPARWVSPIGTEQSTWHPEFVDIREDRVVLFGSIGSSMQEFVYRIKATNKGKFTVPPAHAESMYDRTVRARSLPGVMIVEEQKKEGKVMIAIRDQSRSCLLMVLIIANWDDIMAIKEKSV